MPHAVSMPSPGLQAIILCGPGSSFPTFTSNPEDHPKALLPIANRPMIWYPLEFCYRTGITDITLVCPPQSAAAIRSALAINPVLSGLPLPSPTVLAPKDLDMSTGTAQVLRLPELQELITQDFIVLPCDLVCELGGDRLLRAWMVKAASLSDLVGDKTATDITRSGGLGVWYQTKTATPVKGEETDFVATTPLPVATRVPTKGSLSPHMAKLVQTMPTDSLKDQLGEQKGFSVRHKLAQRHPNIRMLRTHRDAHIYIFPRWIMGLIKENEFMDSIGEDVVGGWAKAGWQPELAEKLHLKEVLEPTQAKMLLSSQDEAGSSPPLTASPKSTQEPARAITLARSLTAAEGFAKSGKLPPIPKMEQQVPPMLAYIHPSGPSEQIIRRVDTAPLLLAVSLQLAKLPSVEEVPAGTASPLAHAKKVMYPQGVPLRSTITKQDTLLAENVTVAEKTAIRESVVGANCQIREGAKLQQCLLMEGVVVGKNCKLTRCVIGKRVEIGDDCVLTDCEVQENLLVEPNCELNRIMASESWLT